MRRILLLCSCLALMAGPASASSPWVHEDWLQRMPFDAAPALIAGDAIHEDFALLVTLNGSDHAAVFSSARSDGADLLFTTRAGATPLEREIVSYDPIGRTAEIWVRVPQLSKLDNEFYLYFENPLANSNSTPTTAWSDAYRAVYHFEDDPADLYLRDSSPAGADVFLSGAHGWTSGDAEPVKIGRGWHLNGSTHHIATNAISTADSSYTIEAWLTHDVENTDFFFHAQPDFWHVSSHMTNQTVDYAGSGAFVRWDPKPIPIAAPPAHYLWKFDAVDDTMLFYYNGVPQALRTFYPSDFSSIYTGRLINPTNADPVGVVGPMYYIVEDFHSGQADEFRLREGRPSSDRILTEFRSANDPGAFLSFGTPESMGATPAPVATQLWLRSFPNPSSGPSSIRYSMPAEGHVRLSVYDLAGRRIATLVDRRVSAGTWTARWDGRTGGGQPVAAGVYFLGLETPWGRQSQKITLLR
jgi:hypothetical protein